MENQERDPQQQLTEESPPQLNQRATRRDVVKAGAATALGVAAAGYVKPNLKGLGVPTLQAASLTPGNGGVQPKPTKTPPAHGKRRR